MLNFSLAPNTKSTPGILPISTGFNCAKQPIIAIKASGFILSAFLDVLIAFYSNPIIEKPLLAFCYGSAKGISAFTFSYIVFDTNMTSGLFEPWNIPGRSMY